MSWKDRFPLFRHHPELIYLDSAATAHKPDAVIEALTSFYSRDYATVHRAAYQSSVRATDLYHSARETARRFLKAAHWEEIVFTRGTTDSINLVARAFPFAPGDEILVSALEHHSNLVPWQMIAQEKNLTLKSIPIHPDGSLDLPAALSPRTKLVAITHVSNVTGAITPLKAVVQLARQVGALVLVDGAQAAPHLPLDVQDLDVDFYAFSSHKCYGPTGIGVLYGKKSHLAALAPLQGGGDMVLRVETLSSTYQEPPLRFEAGTPMIGSAIGLKAALEFIKELGPALNAHECRLLKLATERLSAVDGVRLIGTAPHKGPLVSFTVDGIHPLDLAAWLDCKQIAIRTGHLCAQPLVRLFGCESVARASFGAYNTQEEVEFFVDAVRAARHSLVY